MKKPTCTTIIMEHLINIDDFVTQHQIMDALGLNINQVSATLIHLKKYHAVNCMGDSEVFWYATPENDTRTYQVEEREEEVQHRRARSSFVLVHTKKHQKET